MESQCQPFTETLKLFFTSISIVFALLPLAEACAAPADQVRELAKLASIQGLPLFFEPRPGESPESFIAHGSHYLFSIDSTSAQLALISGTTEAGLPNNATEISNSRVMRFELVGANRRASIQGAELIPGKINYLVGADLSQWRTQVPLYQQVRARQVYPGIDLVYYGHESRLEYDFIVSPGADPGAIAQRFTGIDSITIDANGDLVLTSGSEVVRQPKPTIYQVIDGQRKDVSGGFQLEDSKTVGFILGSYDLNRPLVIDPMLSYSTFFGGNFGEVAYGVKVDTNGFIYIAGETVSRTFLAGISNSLESISNTVPPFHGGRFSGDAFVAKLAPGGTNVVYFTYIGGNGNESARDLAVDDAGNVFITGFTDSTNFPIVLTNVVFGLTNRINGKKDPNVGVYSSDAFIAELASDGASLVYSAYLGGGLAEVATGIALDPAGNAYVTGYTYSSNFPVVNAFQTTLRGTNDVFVSKIAPFGSALLYSTYLGGTNADVGEGIAADSSGVAYVTGYTSSTNFPVTANALQAQISGSTNAFKSYRGKVVPSDAFLLRVDTTQTGIPSLTYSTLFGGTNNDFGYRIVLDNAQNVYITGSSSSTNFPNFNHPTNIRAGAIRGATLNSDAFLTKFHFDVPDAVTMVYSILFGGAVNDTGWGLAVDAGGNTYVAGYTASANFFTNNTFGFLRANNAGLTDAFISAFDTNAASIFSTYLGGGNNDFAYGIALDQATNIYVVGRTLSANFPITAPFGETYIQTNRFGSNDAFLAIISPVVTPLAIARRGTNATLQWPYAPEFKLQSITNVAGTNWITVPVNPALMTNGWNTLTIAPTNRAEFYRLKR